MTRAMVLGLAASVLGACAATPQVQLVIDDADASVAPASDDAPDAAPSPQGSADAASPATDDASPPGASSGAASDASPDGADGTCTMPKGKGGKCCGAMPCIGDHCNAGPTCAACGVCNGHAYCCAQGNNPVQCVDDPNQCD